MGLIVGSAIAAFVAYAIATIGTRLALAEDR